MKSFRPKKERINQTRIFLFNVAEIAEIEEVNLEGEGDIKETLLCVDDVEESSECVEERDFLVSSAFMYDIMKRIYCNGGNRE